MFFKQEKQIIKQGVHQIANCKPEKGKQRHFSFFLSCPPAAQKKRPCPVQADKSFYFFLNNKKANKQKLQTNAGKTKSSQGFVSCSLSARGKDVDLELGRSVTK